MPDTSRYVIAVLLPDRVGALRDVTAAIVELQGNIAGIRQSVVDGYFSLVFTSAHPAGITDEEAAALPSGVSRLDTAASTSL